MLPTIIFLHGGPGFRDYLKPFFIPLEGRFNCVFFDQVRGPSIEMKDQITQLHSLVTAAEGKVVLVGHSWGGVLATEYASKYQKEIAGLVLISTGLRASQWKDEFRTELKSLGLEDATPEQIFLTPSELEIGKILLDSTWSSFSSETFDSLNSTYLNQYDLTVQLASIHVPILNIFGEKDVRFPTRVTKSFRSFNDKITDFEVSGAGHFPFLLVVNRKKIIEIIDQTFSS